MKKSITALLAVALLGSVSATNAAKPEYLHVGPSSISGQVVGQCDGFQIWTDYIVEADIRLFFDQAGQLIRQSAHWAVQGRTRYYNSQTGQSVFGGPGEHEIDHLDIIDNTWAVIAVSWKVTLPGQGQIYLQTGRIIFDIDDILAGDYSSPLFAAGNDDFYAGDVAKLCAALAGP